MSENTEHVVAALKGRLAGDMVQPGDPEFEAARGIWNGIVQRNPGVIVRCNTVGDVQLTVRAASEIHALTAVRCGGHSLAGFSTCEGGVVIDLSRMRQVKVDSAKRLARAQGGSLLGSIDVATQQAGLVFPAGVVSHTGAGGLILGGGTGWLTRLLGLSCDNVAGFTLVTADGSLLRADASENVDLYWALRGGGGNFGVVIEFELQLHPLTSVLIANSLYLEDEIRGVLRFWREFMPGAPDALKWNASVVAAPAVASVPVAQRGRPALTQSLVWFGDETEGRKLFDKALSVSRSVGTTTEVMSFLALQTMADHEFPHGARYYTKSGYFSELDDDSIESMIDAVRTIPSAKNQVELSYLGGAAGRVAATETAFGDRSAPFIVNLLANWNEASEDAANVAWVRELFQTLRPHMRPGVYVNFMSGDEDDRVPEAYHAQWQRLLAVKNRYDPQNFFRLNQNIRSRQALSADPR